VSWNLTGDKLMSFGGKSKLGSDNTSRSHFSASDDPNPAFALLSTEELPKVRSLSPKSEEISRNVRCSPGRSEYQMSLSSSTCLFSERHADIEVYATAGSAFNEIYLPCIWFGSNWWSMKSRQVAAAGQVHWSRLSDHQSNISPRMFVPYSGCLISIIFAIAYNRNLRLRLDFLRLLTVQLHIWIHWRTQATMKNVWKFKEDVLWNVQMGEKTKQKELPANQYAHDTLDTIMQVWKLTERLNAQWNGSYFMMSLFSLFSNLANPIRNL